MHRARAMGPNSHVGSTHSNYFHARGCPSVQPASTPTLPKRGAPLCCNFDSPTPSGLTHVASPSVGQSWGYVR